MAIIKKFRIKSFKKVETIIEFQNVSMSFGSRLILDNISFKVNKNSIHGMLGPNGAGKSTIFNLITGLIKPNSGKIKILGEDVTDYPVYIRSKKFKTGYVPQYGGYFVTSSPSILILPLFGLINPVIKLKIVLFPAPLGPSIP